MKGQSRFWWLVAFLLGSSLLLALFGRGSQAEEPLPALLTGLVVDALGQPVAEAEVTLRSGQAKELLSEANSQPDGRYALVLPDTFPDDLWVHVERPHFSGASINLGAEAVEALRAGQSVVLPDTTLPRRISAAFWIATLVFVAVLVLIATGKLHNTLSALLGASVLFAVSYLGRPLVEDLFVFDFDGALRSVDWNVIFLIMGMMIVIAVVERTGIFQWLAY